MMSFDFDVAPSAINWEGVDINAKNICILGHFLLL